MCYKSTQVILEKEQYRLHMVLMPNIASPKAIMGATGRGLERIWSVIGFQCWGPGPCIVPNVLRAVDSLQKCDCSTAQSQCSTMHSAVC